MGFTVWGFRAQGFRVYRVWGFRGFKAFVLHGRLAPDAVRSPSSTRSGSQTFRASVGGLGFRV